MAFLHKLVPTTATILVALYCAACGDSSDSKNAQSGVESDGSSGKDGAGGGGGSSGSGGSGGSAGLGGSGGSDGGVEGGVCTPGPTWTFETVASNAEPVQELRVDASGKIHIAFADRYATNAGGSWQIDELAGASAAALALESNGDPHVCYGASLLRHAVKQDGQWITEVVPLPTGGMSYIRCSIDVDSAGVVHLAYRYNSVSGGVLGYASRTGTTWTITEGVGTPGVGVTAIAADAAGHAHIAYTRYTGGSLPGAGYAVHYSTNVSGAFVDQTVTAFAEDGDVGIVLQGGEPRIGYAYTGIFVARPTSNGWSVSKAQESAWSPKFAMATDGSGTLHLTSVATNTQYSGELVFSTWNGSAWTAKYVTPAPGFALSSGVRDTALAFDASGRPHIGWVDDLVTLQHISAECL